MSYINWGSESPEQLAIRRQLEDQALYEQAVRSARARAGQAPGVGSSGGVVGGTILIKWSNPSYAIGSLDEWNGFFGLLGTPAAFTRVTVNGDTTILSGTTGFDITDNLFSPGKAGDQDLIEFRDLTGCVNSVGDEAFANCDNLTTVILPAATTIGFAAFSSCDLLQYVDIEQATLIEAVAFADCVSLESLSMPNVEEIGSYAFGAAGLVSINGPSIVTIGNSAFQNCVNLVSVSLPQCTDLGGTVDNNDVFSGVTGNTMSVTIPVALMTCNIGDPDGDIQYLIDNNTVTGLPAVQCNALTLTGLNATTTSNSATNNATGGWDSSAYSTQTYTTPVILKFRTSNDSNILMGGFAYTPTLETDTYLNTTYGIYLTGPESLEIYENGGQVVGGTPVTRSVDDVWKVVYDGTSIKYYQNTTLIHTSTNAVTAPLHVFFAFNTANQGVTNICVL